jgi:hypothetical protein
MPQTNDLLLRLWASSRFPNVLMHAYMQAMTPEGSRGKAANASTASASTAGGKMRTTIAFHLSHALGKVGIKTVPGQPEIIKPLREGPNGFCVADFGDGDEETECTNLLLNIKPIEKPKKPRAKAKAKGKTTAKGKSKATAKGKAKATEVKPTEEESPAEEAEEEEDASAEKPGKKQKMQDSLHVHAH